MGTGTWPIEEESRKATKSYRGDRLFVGFGYRGSLRVPDANPYAVSTLYAVNEWKIELRGMRGSLPRNTWGR